MKDQYDNELIRIVIESNENLGINGFYWGYMDEQFRGSKEELYNSVNKIILCLEWLDRYLNYFTYFSSDYCSASKVKEMIEKPNGPNIPLGCVIVALLYNYNRIEYEKEFGKNDLIFRLPSTERDELKRIEKVIYEL